MSGRVHVTLADGRRVVGHRKTLRQNARRGASPIEHILIFQLPRELAWATSGGAHGPYIDVGPMENVRVRTFDREMTIRKAVEFLQGVAKSQEFVSVSAVLQGADGARDSCQLVARHGGVMFWYGTSKPQYFPPK